MEPEGSLTRLQVPATCPYHEPDQSSPHPHTSNFLKIHLNIILPSTPGFSKLSLSLRFPYQNLINDNVTDSSVGMAVWGMYWIINTESAVVKMYYRAWHNSTFWPHSAFVYKVSPCIIVQFK